jgi:predicted GNAT superfamily acetyltransferase
MTRLSDWTALTILNDGPDERPGSRGDPNPHRPESDAIALEIPANWTAMQQQTPDLAARWRTTTDQLLIYYVKLKEGKYVMTDVAMEGTRRYLIGQRFHQALWDELTQ